MTASSAPQYEDQHFEWRGRTVSWRRLGEGPAVVFCHGTPWSSALWTPYAKALSGDHAVYTWDMPGYGDSSKHPAHAVDLGVQSEVFADLLEHWQLDAPHVVAHDFGGAVSLRAHLLHGREFASLMLVDVVAVGSWGSPFFRLVKENADVMAQLPGPVHEGALRGYISGAAFHPMSEAEYDMLLGPWLTEEGRPAFYRQIAQADERFTDEIRPLLGRVRTPTRVVWGLEDSWLPYQRGEELSRLIPGATLRLLADSGHLVQLDAPVMLADELRAWLRAGGS